MFNQNIIAVNVILLQLSFAYNPTFYFNTRTSYEDIYRFPSHVSFITINILITIIRFANNHLLLVSNSTFMTDSMSLETIQICQNLKEDYYYLRYYATFKVRTFEQLFYKLNTCLQKNYYLQCIGGRANILCKYLTLREKCPNTELFLARILLYSD